MSFGKRRSSVIAAVCSLLLVLSSASRPLTAEETVDGQSAVRPKSFAQRGPMTMARAVASVPAEDFDYWYLDGQASRAGPLELLWSRKLGTDEHGQPTLLVTIHAWDLFPRKHDSVVAYLLRIFGIHGRQLLPRLEFGSAQQRPQLLRLFHCGVHRFVLATFEPQSFGRGRVYHALWLNGSTVREVPIDKPRDKLEHLLAEGERAAYENWILETGETPIAFGYNTSRYGDPGSHHTYGTITGTLKLVEDAQGRPSRFVVDKAGHREGSPPPRPTAGEPPPARRPDEGPAEDLEQRIFEAIEGKGEGAKLAPEQVVALLKRNYQLQRDIPERERSPAAYGWWQKLARRVARKLPQAVRAAATERSEIGEKLQLILGEVGGQENLALLAELCDKRPSRYLILALERSGDREAWPALRRVINRQLITLGDLRLAGLAAEALARSGDGEIVPVMKNWLATDNTDKLRMAIHAAGLLGDNRLVPDLLKVDANVFGSDRSLLYRALVSCGNVRYLDKVHQAAVDEREYLYEVELGSPDPAIAVPIWNHTQNRALDAIAKLASLRSLPVLDKLAAGASDPIIRQRTAAIAKTIRE